MVKVSPIEAGLNPKKFLESTGTLMEIGHNEAGNDCITEIKRTSKADGKEYSQLTLHVTGSDGEWAGDFKVNYLFDRDLKALVDAWGEESKEWLGKRITLKARKEGDFNRWIIEPFSEEVKLQE